MWNSWLSNSTLPSLEQSAAFAQKRHMLLAGNIANMDVPGYKTRDLSVENFQSALRESLATKASSGVDSISRTAAEQIAAERVRDVGKQVLYHDGSDVSLEHQVTEISKNQAMHDMAIGLMRSQFQTMQVAIRESVAV